MVLGFHGQTTIGQDHSGKNVENDSSGKSSPDCMQHKLQMFDVQYSSGAATLPLVSRQAPLGG